MIGRGDRWPGSRPGPEQRAAIVRRHGPPDRGRPLHGIPKGARRPAAAGRHPARRRMRPGKPEGRPIPFRRPVALARLSASSNRGLPAIEAGPRQCSRAKRGPALPAEAIRVAPAAPSCRPPPNRRTRIGSQVFGSMWQGNESCTRRAGGELRSDGEGRAFSPPTGQQGLVLTRSAACGAGCWMAGSSPAMTGRSMIFPGPRPSTSSG